MQFLNWFFLFKELLFLLIVYLNLRLCEVISVSRAGSTVILFGQFWVVPCRIFQVSGYSGASEFLVEEIGFAHHAVKEIHSRRNLFRWFVSQ